MASKLQRRMDAKICLSLTYALNDREEVLKTKLLFPLSMNQQHAVISNNSSVYECSQRVRKTASNWKCQVHLQETPRRLQSTAPWSTILKRLLSTVTPTLASQVGTRWMEHSKTCRWSKRAQLPFPWSCKASLLVQELKTAALDSLVHVVSQPFNL